MAETMFTQMFKPFMLIQFCTVFEKKNLFCLFTHVAFWSDKTFFFLCKVQFQILYPNLVPVLLLNKGLMNESNQVCYFNNRFFLVNKHHT